MSSSIAQFRRPEPHSRAIRCGIGLEAGNVLLGEVVEPRDVALLLGRHGEDLLEGADLVPGDDAVGLRHLGRKRDHGDREGDLAPAKLRIALEKVRTASTTSSTPEAG